MRRMRWGPLMLAAALLLSACAADTSDSVSSGGQTPSVPETPTDTKPGATLDFATQDLDGNQVDAATFQGEALALWFWAPW